MKQSETINSRSFWFSKVESQGEHERFPKKKWKEKNGNLQPELITSPRSWGTTSRHDLPPHTVSHPERWHRLHIAAYSSTPPSATRWSGGHNAPRWKWRHRCTNHQLQDKETWGKRHDNKWEHKWYKLVQQDILFTIPHTAFTHVEIWCKGRFLSIA